MDAKFLLELQGAGGPSFSGVATRPPLATITTESHAAATPSRAPARYFFKSACAAPVALWAFVALGGCASPAGRVVGEPPLLGTPTRSAASPPALRDAPAGADSNAPVLRDAPTREASNGPVLRDAPDALSALEPPLRDAPEVTAPSIREHHNSPASSAYVAPVLRDSPSSEPKPAPALALELLEAHNAERARAGLPRLHSSEALAEVAAQHARDMAERGKISHTGSDAANLKVRLARAAYSFDRAGENVAMGQANVSEVMSGWMHSRGHRRNILANYEEMGAAVARGADGQLYWCVEFGSPAGAFDASAAQPRQESASAPRHDTRS